jgi:hypothetical protein
MKTASLQVDNLNLFPWAIAAVGAIGVQRYKDELRQALADF